MTTLIFVLIFTAVLAGLGWSVVLKLDKHDCLAGGERLIISIAVGLFAIYFGVFAIGPFRLDGVSMWALFALCAGGAIPGWRAMPWKKFKKIVGLEYATARQDKWAAMLWITVFAVGFSSLLQGLAPPNDYDSLLYQLLYPQIDVEQGRIKVAWYSGVGNSLFPAMAGNLSRILLTIMNDGAAQMMHGMLGLIAAMGTAAIVLRLGYSKYTALIAALFFLSVRAVVWEMGTVEVDVPLAMFAVLAALVYCTLRQNGTIGLGILFGLMVGGGILTKLYGFPMALAFAPLMIIDLARRRLTFVQMSAGPITAMAVIIPHLVRNFMLTGNPLFPALNTIFNPGQPNHFGNVTGALGTGRGLSDLLTTPWNIFVYPMHNFDGMIFGSPYILVLAPLLLIGFRDEKRWLPLLSVTAVYYVLWFYVGGHQVRFLIPIMPLLAAMAAGGAVLMWENVKEYPVIRSIFAGIVLVIAANQVMFVGIYTLLRMPVAVGLMDDGAYHANTPTMNGAFYATCSYLRKNLKPGETYYSLGENFYYCPQSSVTSVYFPDEEKWWLDSEKPPEMKIQEFLRRADEKKFRYFFLPVAHVNRRNDTARTVPVTFGATDFRFGKYIIPAMLALKPLHTGPFSAVYDGPHMIAKLKEIAGQ
jgi:4-amino-4-deoxy-L-arabinose transferase-like glycosyltransferase